MDKRMTRFGAAAAAVAIAALLIAAACAIALPHKAYADGSGALAYSLGSDGTTKTEYTTTDQALAAGYDGKVIYLNSDWNLTSTLTIKEGTTITIDMNGHKIANDGKSGVISVSKKANLTLKGSQKKDFTYSGYSSDDGSKKDFSATTGGLVTGGSTDGGGGIILAAEATLTLDGVSVAGNHANYGGGVYCAGEKCNVYLKNAATVQRNNATYGAGLCIGYNHKDCNVYLDGASSINDNYAGYEGGGIYIDSRSDGARVYMNGNSSICNNAATCGGGYYAEVNTSYVNIKSDDKTGSIKNNKTRKNSKDSGDGAAIFICGNNWGSDAGSIDGLTISGNSSETSAGAIRIDQNNTEIKNCTITNNSAGNNAGGIYVIGKNTSIENCTITGNKCGGGGGGVLVDCTQDIKVSGLVTIKDNVRTSDGSADDVFLGLEPNKLYNSYLVGTVSEGSRIGIRDDYTGNKMKVAKEVSDYKDTTYFMDQNNSYHLVYDSKDKVIYQIKGGVQRPDKFSMLVDVPVVDTTLATTAKITLADGTTHDCSVTWEDESGATITTASDQKKCRFKVELGDYDDIVWPSTIKAGDVTVSLAGTTQDATIETLTYGLDGKLNLTSSWIMPETIDLIGGNDDGVTNANDNNTTNNSTTNSKKSTSPATGDSVSLQIAFGAAAAAAALAAAAFALTRRKRMQL
jgi:parallel beta-helix repeat protein